VSVLAAAAVGVLSPAAAETTFTPSSGNDQTLFAFETDVSCPTGALAASYALIGPNQDFVVDGQGGLGPAPLSGGGGILNSAVANLRTANAQFATGPFPQTYTFTLVCSDESGDTLLPFGTMTVTAIGTTGTTWTIQAPTPTGTPTTTPATTPATTTSPATTTPATTSTPVTTTPATTTSSTTSTPATTASGTTGTTSGTTTPGFFTTSPTSTTSAGGFLPRTGGDVALPVALGLGLVGGGAALVALATRRRPAGHHQA
jgi:hypothetical protein